MPDEPNSKIDRLLRDYARERRKNPAPVLHPANRRLLQEEVRRNYPQFEARSWWQTVRRFWPQFAFAGGLGVILIIAVLSLERRPRTQVLHEPAPNSARPMAPPPSREELPVLQKAEPEALNLEEQAGKPVLEKNEMAKDKAQLADKGADSAAAVRQERLSVNRAAPALPKELKPVSATAETAPRDSRTVESRRAFAPAQPPQNFAFSPESEVRLNRAVNEPAVSGPVLARKVALAGQLTNLGAARRTAFVRVPDRAAGGAAIAPDVLTSFQFEELGPQLRVADTDGSLSSTLGS